MSEPQTEGGRAVEAFKKICKPNDENNLDYEWLEMCGFFVKGWLSKDDSIRTRLAEQEARIAELEAFIRSQETEPK